MVKTPRLDSFFGRLGRDRRKTLGVGGHVDLYEIQFSDEAAAGAGCG